MLVACVVECSAEEMGMAVRVLEGKATFGSRVFWFLSRGPNWGHRRRSFLGFVPKTPTTKVTRAV